MWYCSYGISAGTNMAKERYFVFFPSRNYYFSINCENGLVDCENFNIFLNAQKFVSSIERNILIFYGVFLPWRIFFYFLFLLLISVLSSNSYAGQLSFSIVHVIKIIVHFLIVLNGFIETSRYLFLLTMMFKWF